jgi:hypothetical protein
MTGVQSRAWTRVSSLRRVGHLRKRLLKTVDFSAEEGMVVDA